MTARFFGSSCLVIALLLVSPKARASHGPVFGDASPGVLGGLLILTAAVEVVGVVSVGDNLRAVAAREDGRPGWIGVGIAVGSLNLVGAGLVLIPSGEKTSFDYAVWSTVAAVGGVMVGSAIAAAASSPGSTTASGSSALATAPAPVTVFSW